MKSNLTFLVIILLSSCAVQDMTLNAPISTCDLHNIVMKKTVVRAWSGTPANWSLSENKSEYKNAKGKIHLGGVGRADDKKYARVYHCKECNKLKRNNK